MPLANVNGVNLYYELSGNERGKTVVFVNGLLADTSSWAQHIPFFEGTYRLVTYDARGQGRSDKPPGPYPIELHARDLTALLDDHLGIPRASFVGLSNGGAALLRLAVERPDLVERLVVADGYSHVDNILEAKLDAWARAAEISSDLRFAVAVPYVWSNKFLGENKELFAAFRDKASVFPKEAALSLIEGAKDHDVSDRLKEVSAPTLIAVGEDDLLTPVRHAEEMHRAISGSRLLVIPNAGHAAPIEQPDLFSRAVIEFLEEG